MSGSPLRVLIVDDSAVVRKLLADALRGDPDFTVVGGAADPFVARDLILQFAPDVLTLDIEMPRMDGLSFLKRLMAHRPMPVVVISSITQRGSAASIEALRLGAIEVLAKPGGPSSVGGLAADLKRCLRGLRNGPPPRFSAATAAAATAAAAPPGPVALKRAVSGLIVVGASTGGTQAIEAVLTRMPAGSPPIVIVQHMPAMFTNAFASRLDRVCAVRVVEATDGDVIKPGTAYVAPGDYHLTIARHGVQLRTQLNQGPPVHYQRPAVDVMFQSAARLRGVSMVGVLLTGMGQDGADGMVALRRAGAITLAQDEQSCVVFGMPKEAIARGGATRVATLLQMPELILSSLDKPAAA